MSAPVKRIVVLGGAGAMGAGIVRDLISPQSDTNTHITVADISPDRIGEVIAEFDPARVSALALDVTDAAALADCLAAADLCMNAVPTFAGLQMTIFNACLSAGCAYADLGGMGVYTVRQKAEHEKWRAAGAMAVLGLGADPGMSNVICRAVADRLERIDKINLYWAAELAGPENPVLVPPYNIETVLGEYANPSQQFLGGALVEVAPQTGQETLQLPAPWGETEFMYSQHSEPLTVPFADGIRDKGIGEFTWKLHLPKREHEAWVGLVKAGFGDFETPIDVKGVSLRPSEMLDAMIRHNMAKRAADIPVQETHEIHLAIGEGERGGERLRVEARVTADPDPLYDGYLDAATSMNASLAAQLMLRGDARAGVWAPEEFFDVTDYFAELRKRHFEITLEEAAL